jgi:hypothetical protein
MDEPMKSNAAPTPHSPMWAKREAPSARQIEAETKAAEIGALMRDLLSGPNAPAMAALMNAEFARRGFQYRVHRKTGAPPRR